uniref:Band 7 domain-containing protein n=1 Tax=Euplotes harpa TaxID=151035 RepID=A0A7S3J0Q2_9SPIT|mmetsp:Transcript_13155/g.15228  ORF Transcript_13155/g.15228 Transcript_13155/m.15228 type:complete len:276 (+) Transcript_13155:108-935(+)|eukprot:CAMPEP_0168337992 /NCGR_PEP_ID=MMETSP0213-20121227/12541_1 /TAXON_ID=151035 /ORGANISM="Euplotes harpa, Strain FSP1.4" /LENGTH=275 /DNA_ID=CAMNT_0008343629 /DNA_START=211 /DNA_END=1038 /DNA_ORIENTATION=+
MIHRFQKFHKQVQPGLNFKIPFIDSIEYIHDLREQVVEISSQVAVTKDNVALHIDGVLYLKIEDPYKASYGVESITSAITNLAQTTMRSEIGKLTLDKTFEERDRLNDNIVNAIDKETQDWGARCVRYEIKDIEPPNNIQKSMILQAEAERKKRANMIESEGEKQYRINLAEAKKRSQVLRAEGDAEAIIKRAEASANALISISKALENRKGQDAANFLLGERYIEAYKKIAGEQNTLILESAPLMPVENVTSSFNLLQKLQKEEQKQMKEVNKI